jgi:hypothetical protein
LGICYRSCQFLQQNPLQEIAARKGAWLAKQGTSIKRIIFVRWFERRRMGGSGSVAASPFT